MRIHSERALVSRFIPPRFARLAALRSDGVVISVTSNRASVDEREFSDHFELTRAHNDRRGAGVLRT